MMLPETVLGFEAIGMTKLASVFSEAASFCGSPYPREQRHRRRALTVASELNEEELEDIFKDATDIVELYSAFVEVTKTLPFLRLGKDAHMLAKSEAGDFQEAATRYANNLVIDRSGITIQ
jgi:hypothetical protein